MKRVIIGDSHIMTVGCDLERICDFIDSLKCDELIIGGDFYDRYGRGPSEFRRDGITKSPLRCAVLNRDVGKVIYIRGNHDVCTTTYSVVGPGTGQVIAFVDVVDRYEYDDRVVVHGHQYDWTQKVANWSWLISAQEWWERETGKNFQAELKLRYNWLIKRFDAGIRKKLHAAFPGKVIVTGHTHDAEADPPNYFNWGCTGNDGVFTWIDDTDGNITLRMKG